jgi:hypothetical protein
LNTSRYALVTANQDLDSYIQTYLDHPEIVTARNLASMYMKTGDVGTMIKVAGGDYIVTPANSSGPFIVRVSKKPASPAEGKLYVDFSGALAHPTITTTQQINVLGDGTGIKEGDLLLCFRDSLGSYYTPGGGGTGSVGFAKVLTTTANKNAVSVGIWLTANFTGTQDITTTAKMPSLASPYKVPAGTWAPAVKLGDQWVLQIPLVLPYIA